MKQTILIIGLIITAIATLPVVFSDDDWREYKQLSLGVSAISDPLYKEECGSCHMAYPPGLLPAASWQKMMLGLEDHFGDNAEIAAEDHQLITQFLTKNSADDSSYRRSRRIVNSLKQTDVPLRISATPYFLHEHDEIPDRLVSKNDKVKSFSNCNACHQQAEQGMFDEHSIRIPGHGRWDD
ncbi:MAG: diheme cytochrome c [Gammaproteobacteria bacterium]|nr:diheme cytochrome c [Gammaproteobacteria bacterium]